MPRIWVLMLVMMLLLGGLASGVASAQEAASQPATQSADAGPRAGGNGLWDKFRQGGTTAIVQLALSVIGAAYALERLYNLRRKNILPAGVSDRARSLWQQGKFAELEKLGDTEPSTLSRAIAFIARHRHNTAADISATAGDVISREMALHSQRIYPMGVVATLEPLLGLLGMVLGMIETFEKVAFAGALGDPSQLAAGISEAMVTTALGLGTAIPFLALYHYFKYRIGYFSLGLEDEVSDLINDWILAPAADKASGRVMEPALAQ